jgi:hypothetical protein
MAGWLGALALVVAAMLLVLARPFLDEDSLPANLRSRSAGRLVPGPFPRDQSPAARLDLVAADRLVALRELAARRGR